MPSEFDPLVVDRLERGTIDDAHASEEFRRFVYPHDDPRIAPYRGMDPRAFARARVEHVPPLEHAMRQWRELHAAPFVGVTTDGVPVPDLFPLMDLPPEQAAPTAEMVRAAELAIAALSDSERERWMAPLDSPDWRAWSNPEVIVFDTGLRLEEASADARAAILGLVEASLGARGFSLVRSMMRLNGFLGELCDLPLLMNEHSYYAALFGEPSLTEPWGWHLFGHHVGLNVFVLGTQMVIAPVFLGAEPAFDDGNRFEGCRAFDLRQDIALRFIRSLDPEQLSIARAFDAVRHPDLPEGRLHPADERHLAGAFQDNRVIPAEGIRADALDARQQDLLLDLIADHLLLYPDGPAAAKLAEIRDHLDETSVTWIGGMDRLTPFYFRIQSPVFLAEFDHHAGVWLSNTTPATFHVHTLMRTPNGNDYGKALLAQWESRG